MAAPSVSPPVQGPYRILHVFRAPVGGLFRHVMDLARLQASAGHRVGIVCDANTGGERARQHLADLAPSLALGVTRVPMNRNPGPTDLSALLAVRAVAERVRAEVLHGHGAKGGLYVRLAPVAPDGRAVIRTYTPHGGSYNYRPGSALHRFYMGVEGLLARRTDAFLFESAYVAERHRRYVGEHGRLARVVHNGLADAEFEPVAPAARRFDLLYVGELREAKGIPWLLDAMAMLRDGGRPLSLLMVGSGPDEAALRSKAAALRLAGAVTFEPPQAIRPVLARSRIMVVPSLAESLPYVVLEAAAAQQPLVATNAGGIPEIFGASAGDLVPTRDAAALAQAIARVLDEPAQDRAARFAALSASVRAGFSLQRMGTSVLEGYAAAFQSRALTSSKPEVAPESTVPGRGSLSLP